MIVAFCGHSTYAERAGDRTRVLALIEREAEGEAVEFFLGEYGGFDRFASSLARAYKESHPGTVLSFISPYLDETYLSRRDVERFDRVIYPEIEETPRKFAISARNRWIAGQADLVIAYVKHEYGGAYAMLRTALAKGKRIFNLTKIKP